MNNINSPNNLSQRTKTLLIQKSIPIRQINKQLSSARIRTGSGKDHGSSRVGDFDGVIAEILGAPFGLYLGTFEIESVWTDE